jgi:hypothetical protein
MQKNCPKCNRPIRAGAKFCGFCGATLAPVSPAVSLPPRKNNEASCPHCNAALRPGVKFCANCGKPISPQPAAVQAAPPASPPPQPPSVKPAAPASPPPAAARPAPTPGRTPTARERRAKRSRGRFVIYLGLLLVICLVITIPGAIFGPPLVRDLLEKTTPTSTVTETMLPSPTNTSTLTPTTTLTATTTATAEPSPTFTLAPTTTATRILPPTYTSTPLPPLLETDFSQLLDTLWEIWGDPNTVRVTDEINPALMLTGVDVDSSGVSSLEDTIAFEPGLVILFTTDQPPAAINAGNAQLRFAWSPGPDTPLESTDPLPLQLLIEPTRLTFTVQFEDNIQNTCEEDLEPGIHNFRLEVNELLEPLIFVDGEQVCQSLTTPDPSFNLTGGRIHFSGSGLVDDVVVGYER